MDVKDLAYVSLQRFYAAVARYVRLLLVVQWRGLVIKIKCWSGIRLLSLCQVPCAATEHSAYIIVSV